MNVDYPPFPGIWVKREEVTGGLDAARQLDDIAWYSEHDRKWVQGITSEQVQYWVRVCSA